MSQLLVFGSINLDISLRVPSLPRPGETVMATHRCMTAGGKGANQAHAASLYGAPVTLVGAVGNDAFAKPALDWLERSRVDLRGVRHLDQASTGLATVHVSEDGENAIVVDPGSNAEVRAHWVDNALIHACRTLLLQWELPPEESMELAARMRARGGLVILNLAPVRNLAALRPNRVDWLIVNHTELLMVCDQLLVPALSIEAAMRAIADAWSCSVAVTLGAEGALACLTDGRLLRVPTRPVNAFDTTGAGDTFCGVLAAAMALGEPTEDALMSACTAASIACTRAGAQASQPSRDEVLAARATQTAAAVRAAA